MEKTSEKGGALIKRQWFIQARSGKIEDYYDFNKDKDALGQGTYGAVFKAKLKGSTQVRAIKHIPKVRVKNQERFKTEIDIMRNLDHPNIIKLYETFEDAQNVFLVMEICSGGELFDRIVSKGYFQENYARNVFVQIMRAINYCHQNKISHRDLKPENFLFLTQEEDSPIKLIDFGLSKVFGDQTAKPGPAPTEPAPAEKDEKKPGRRREKKAQMQTKAGTPYYIAPEVLSGSYDETCDIWSAGVILYILLCGYPPFYGDSDGQILESVKKGVYDFSGPEWKTVSEDAKELIKKMLTKPENRLHAHLVLKHPWCVKLEEGQPKAQVSLKQLQVFQGYKTLKKAALTYIASQVGQSEIKDIRSTFEKLDSNGDGVLTFDELKAGLVDVGDKTKELQATLDAIDTDGNGFINYTEFVAACLDKKTWGTDERLKAAFTIFDKDGDGRIVGTELKDVIGAAEGKTLDKGYWDAIIKEGDVDMDGAINYKEFLALMEN